MTAKVITNRVTANSGMEKY